MRDGDSVSRGGKPLIHRLFTVASVLSLLICVAVLGLWARSDERRDEVRFHWYGSAYAVASESGRVGIDNRPQVDEFLGRREQAIEEAGAASMASRDFGDGPRPEMARWVQANERAAALISRGPPPARRYAIPYWTIFVVGLMIPAIWAWRWHRRSLRIAAGRCSECGYDLRASKGRCPECGTPIPEKATATCL